ncbi:C-type lectin domain family 2 member A-like isoform X1 [Moschus berezovskii]|uniref:C-type lectin domain family 2 member A-like isoform X1 n=1 Tax=Moschus berezovskii TaxID=68408 RepID=UPI00244413C1|nr:C-type lectin domain family 2 member A-like isoform X1 [Moschus berezovskii]
MTSSYTRIYLPEEAPSVEAIHFHQSPCLQGELQALPASTGDTPKQAVCKLKKGQWEKFLIPALIFIVTVLSYSVLHLISSESTKAMECSEEWIGVQRKCFYFSDDTRNWTASKSFCSLQGSELAQIDTPEDMKFLKKHAGTSMYWIGLSRKLGESWKWTNGTTFNAGFEISGNGPFAFLNSDGVHSSRGFVDIKWICSKPISKIENKLGNE